MYCKLPILGFRRSSNSSFEASASFLLIIVLIADLSSLLDLGTLPAFGSGPLRSMMSSTHAFPDRPPLRDITTFKG